MTRSGHYGTSPSYHLVKKNLLQLILLALVSATQTQIISHELRRLAVATNQFGIDSLKALDKIEPPDKVLVFCPVCLSSTLMMIMMGSSKYQVVSSLRHALYVWSMKPQEINRGFKDIFQHIGLNQNSESARAQSAMMPVESSRSHVHAPVMNGMYSTTELLPIERSLIVQPRPSLKLGSLSLPNLIKFKDGLESSSRISKPWWHSISKRVDTNALGDPLDGKQSTGVNQTVLRASRLVDFRDASDSSQMSAMCNVYIQRGLTMNYNYNLLLRQYYNTVIHPVDFIKNNEETRHHINALVAANTENKIKDLVKRSHFGRVSAPKILMISTFHFRGTLDIEMKSPRKPNITSSSQSENLKQRQKWAQKRRARRQVSQHKVRSPQFIETESTLLKYGHFTSLGSSVIEIPFNNRLVSLVVIMPDHHNTTDLMLTRLSAQVLSDMINSLVVKKLSLEIPVIKFDRGPINIDGLLKELGLESIFFGNQTFSTESGLNRWMQPTDILHETSIDIGTLNPNWGVPEDRLKVGAHDSRSVESNHIRLDRPFFYFVMDSINSLILTMGRIRH